VLKSLSLHIVLFLLLSGFVYAQTNNLKSAEQNKITSKNSVVDNDSKLPRILVDEEYNDWETYPNLSQITPGAPSDRVLKVINDSDILYIYFETDSIISLQNNNSWTLFIDSDDNSNTGKPVNGIGAEIEFRFGEREGRIFTNNQQDTVGVGDLFLIILPTVWSDKYEITLDLNSSSGGRKLFNTSTIRILIKDTSSGVSIPAADGAALYTIGDNSFSPLKSYSLDKQSDDFIRVLSHNVEFSGFFRSDRKDAYMRMYQVIQPDIIGFSELYQDYKLEDITTRLEEILPSPKGKSWKAKRTSDNVLATRYSFIDDTSAGPFGNGAFLLDLRPKFNNDLLVVVAHPTCCDNDSSRQHEVDAIAAFLRDSKESGVPFKLTDKTPVIIMGDMNFVGDPYQVKTLLEGDIFHEDLYGEDFTPDWDDTFLDDAKPLSSNLPHAFTHTGFGGPGTYANGRLDYIIYSGSVLDLENSFVLFTPAMPQELLNKYNIRNDDSKIASDHLPVVVDFRLTHEQDETSIYALRQNDKEGVPLYLNSAQTITGTVTSSREFGDDGIAFIQNEQAAIAVDGGDIMANLEAGDFITLSGDVSQRSGLTLLTHDLQKSQLVVHKKSAVPKPRDVTIADVHGQEWDGRELLEGRLIKIENVQLLSSGNFEGESSYKISDDRDTLEIKIDSNINLVNMPIPVERISVTGCLVQNKSSAPYNNGYLLYPRSAEDIDIIKPIQKVPILSLRQNNSQGIPIYLDSVKTISGIVTATNQFGRNGPVIIQDDGAGMALYGSAYVSKLKMGDSVSVTGPLMVHRGMAEYYYDAEICEIIIHNNVALPEPKPVTIAEILNQKWDGIELLESRLVTVNDVQFIDKGNFDSYRNYQLTDGVNQISLRINRAGSLSGTKIPTAKVSVIGIISQYKSQPPYEGGYQILTRFPDDVIIK